MTCPLLSAAGLLLSGAPPAQVDLRPAFDLAALPPKAQGSRGCCSLFAVVGVLEFELAQAGRPARLSEEYLNWASHQTNARSADGSFFSDALVGLERYGICTEDLMPYAETFDPEARPSDQAGDEAASRRHFTAGWIKEWDVETGLTSEQFEGIRRALAAEHPVAVGLRWPKNAVFDANHLLGLPPPEDVFDGHSIVFVGYRNGETWPGGGVFVFRNSSGPDWQDGGHAYMPYAYAMAYANDAVTIVPSDR